MKTRWKMRKCPDESCQALNRVTETWCDVCLGDIKPEHEITVVELNLEGAGQARSTDPGTAKAAAAIKITRGTQRWKVLEAIRNSGAHGATSHELEDLTGIRYASLTPRIGELKRGGFIKATERTRRGRYNVEQEVLVVKVDTGPDPWDPTGDDARLPLFGGKPA